MHGQPYVGGVGGQCPVKGPWERLASLEDEEVGQAFGGVAPADTGIAIGARGGFSYPTAIAHGDGLAVASTWKRRQIALAFVDVPGGA